MLKALKIYGYSAVAGIRHQPAANYLIGGFVKYYSDARHPEWHDLKPKDREAPVKHFKIRLDLLTYIMEVTITNDDRRK